MEFSDLAFSPLMRMNEVSRYSSVYQETDEHLSDHIVDVSMMSYMISKELMIKYHEEIDLSILLERCLLHDIDEVITGDIPRNTKYATRESHQVLGTVAEKAVELLEKDIDFKIKPVWSSAKVGKEGLILKISDMLSVAKKCLIEVELRNNLTFLKVVSELCDHLLFMNQELNSYEFKSQFCQESLDFLETLIRSALAEIKPMIDKYQFFIKKYHIKQNIIECEQ